MDSLHRALSDFGRHLRDPHHVRRPAGISARSAEVYAELLFNNLSSFLDACFPVSRSVLGEVRWRRLERRFFRDWPCRTPLFHEIPKEFLDFLATLGPSAMLPMWFAQLAHYEWAELSVDTMDRAMPACRADGDLMAGRVVANPVALNLAYDWPVHRIGPDYRPRRRQPTRLAIFRDRLDTVRFTLLTPASARLLELLSAASGNGGLTGEEAVLKLAGELGHPAPERLLAFGAEEIRALHRIGLLLGIEP